MVDDIRMYNGLLIWVSSFKWLGWLCFCLCWGICVLDNLWRIFLLIVVIIILYYLMGYYCWYYWMFVWYFYYGNNGDIGWSYWVWNFVFGFIVEYTNWSRRNIGRGKCIVVYVEFFCSNVGVLYEILVFELDKILLI